MSVLHPIGDAARQLLHSQGLDADHVAALVRAAILEDLDGGVDVTSVATVPAAQRSRGVFAARQAGTIAGLGVAAAVFDTVCGADEVTFEHLVDDGTRVTPGAELALVEGRTVALLTAERTALNFLGHLSGVATLTSRWVDALGDTGARVRDTRKTLPGLRALQKYAVRAGGGVNHRMALSDAALVKDNHVLAAGGVREAFLAVRGLAATIPVEVEVDSLDGLREAIDAGADVVLLDNFTTDELRAAVAVRAEQNPDVVLEASGGLTLEVAHATGATGVDYIAVGELTHSVRVLDIGLDLRDVTEP